VTATALLLVATAALSHAVWNMLTKRSVDKIVFLWWTGVVGSILFLPIAAWHTGIPSWPIGVWASVALAAAIRASYFAALSAAYTRGDLSLVYPLARGIPPALVPPLAIIVLGEHVTLTGAAGVAVVVLGIYVIHVPTSTGRRWRGAIHALGSPHAWYAVVTGLMTVSYSLVDKWNMARGVPPLVYAYLTIPIAALVLTPLGLRDRKAALTEWRLNRGAIAAVAVLMTGGYLLVLLALQMAPVSYVAPARELGIVFAAILGTTLLRERYLGIRVTGAGLIVVGIGLLTIARW
jgi:drug/metabolite transporter (DMT)-like permease